RFPPLEVFRRRPPVRAAPSVSGWHPKTFTLADSCTAANSPSSASRYVEVFAGAEVDHQLELGRPCTRTELALISCWGNLRIAILSHRVASDSPGGVRCE